MTDAPVEHFDVVIIGAGISGIGAAHYLSTEQPNKSFVVLEARDQLGGTWDLFRYPGIRSDSDLHTFGYEFEPWRERESIAGAPRILNYLQETATRRGLTSRIRCRRKVVAANWSTATARWTLDVEDVETAEVEQVTANWIFNATGYYRYDQGYTPTFDGAEDFDGTVVHPQHWPEDLDYTGKKVVVIGSGATAVTIVPAMAPTAEHVTMLQRTPTYVMAIPTADPVAVALNKIFGTRRGYALTRRKNIAQQAAIWQFSQRFPNAARKLIRRQNIKQLPEGYPVDEHFNPPYNPWEQRLCAVPDGDLFKAIKAGDASVVTDQIARFTSDGIELRSGRTLEADIIVTATGLNLQMFGGMAVGVDGVPLVPRETTIYRGTMLTGVPNFALAIGYTNSSWTLKVGLLCEYFCRLLGYMDANGYDAAWVEPDPGMEKRPLLDFGAGYVQRSLADLPSQGPASPWLMSKSYQDDTRLLRSGDVVDRHLHFSGPSSRGHLTPVRTMEKNS
jgi:cation diffusion facilitator CzcD-associated flavoprotein CzcO